MIHRDHLKQVINLYDNVAFVPPNSRELRVGTVLKINPKTVTIRYLRDCFFLGLSTRTLEYTCTRDPSNVIRINEQAEIAKEENPEEYI